MEEDAEKIESICRKKGATSLRVAKDASERDKIWAAGRGALSALAQLKPALVLENVTVPGSKIPGMVRAIEDIVKRYNLAIGTFGHAGDAFIPLS